jgi:hypothetical protein
MHVNSLIFFSKGLPSYALCAFFQAHISNPEVPIYLISDINPRLPFVQWENLENYSNHYQQFAKTYTHLNTCQEWLTRIWFYRWFAVQELMRNLNLTNTVHLDTDILLYSDLNNFNLCLPEDKLAIGSAFEGPYSGHCAFLPSAATLSPFLSLCHEMFTDPIKLQIITSFYEKQKHRPGGGGICDMYAFGWASGWRGTTEVRVPTSELNDPDRLGTAFDQSITDDRTCSQRGYYLMRSGCKVTEWNNGWHFVKKQSSKLIPITTMHFQGWNKLSMVDFVTHKPLLFRWCYQKHRLRERISYLKERTSFWYRHGRNAVVKRIKRTLFV